MARTRGYTNTAGGASSSSFNFYDARPKVSGSEWWGWPGCPITSTNTNAQALNVDVHSFFLVRSTITLNTVAIHVTANATASTAYVGVERVNSDLQPSALIAESTFDMSTTGAKTWATGGLVLTPGWYGTVLNKSSSTPTLRFWTVPIPFAVDNVGTILGSGQLARTAGAYGGTPSAWTGNGGGLQISYTLLQWTPSS